MKLPKDLTKALKPYLNKGTRHYKATSPTGVVVSISHTSSCPHYIKHVIADLNRVERNRGE